MESEFFMLFCENGNSPKYKHKTFDEARKEAARIATIEQKKVYILHAIEYCEVNNVKYVGLRQDKGGDKKL